MIFTYSYVYIVTETKGHRNRDGGHQVRDKEIEKQTEQMKTDEREKAHREIEKDK